MSKMRRGFGAIAALLVLLFATTAIAEPTSRPSIPSEVMAGVTAKGPLLLHLPGIAGPRFCDNRMLAGLRGGGVEANFVIYDWTENDPGIHALQSYDRNRAEAKAVADLIAAHVAADPTSPIYLTAHSGGTAIAIWALEDLPPEIKVKTLLLMAPALSPQYDLSKALRHVEGNSNVFTSTLDTVVLSTGTSMFGTMDGIHTAAAGFGGFVQPPGADPEMYRKLIQHPYDRDWIKYGDYGEHIGAMSRRFAQAILSPLIEKADPPATTQPSR
jgi:pimeloyl-ACP methyl ester carboxylesterase